MPNDKIYMIAQVEATLLTPNPYSILEYDIAGGAYTEKLLLDDTALAATGSPVITGSRNLSTGYWIANAQIRSCAWTGTEFVFPMACPADSGNPTHLVWGYTPSGGAFRYVGSYGPAGLTDSAGSGVCFDGRYLYHHCQDIGSTSQIIRTDVSGANPTVLVGAIGGAVRMGISFWRNSLTDVEYVIHGYGSSAVAYATDTTTGQTYLISLPGAMHSNYGCIVYGDLLYYSVANPQAVRTYNLLTGAHNGPYGATGFNSLSMAANLYSDVADCIYSCFDSAAGQGYGTGLLRTNLLTGAATMAVSHLLPETTSLRAIIAAQLNYAVAPTVDYLDSDGVTVIQTADLGTLVRNTRGVKKLWVKPYVSAAAGTVSIVSDGGTMGDDVSAVGPSAGGPWDKSVSLGAIAGGTAYPFYVSALPDSRIAASSPVQFTLRYSAA